MSSAAEVHLSVPRLLLAVVLTIAGGLSLIWTVWDQVFRWLRDERHLYCYFVDDPTSEAYGWRCPDGSTYFLPWVLGAAACFALAFVIGILIAHLGSRAAIRLGNGTWLVDAAAVVSVVYGVLLIGAGALTSLKMLGEGAEWRAASGVLTALVASAAAIFVGIRLRRSLWAGQALRRPGWAALAGLLFPAVCVATYWLWPGTAWLISPLAMIAGALLFGGAALMLSGRSASR